MKKTIMACAFLVGAFFCIGQYAVGAESECNVFSASRWGGEQIYTNCEECLGQSRQCEKRCFDTNATCTAVGYDRYGFRSTVQGPQAQKERRARKKAVRQCEQQGLRDCAIDRCTEEKVLRPESVEVCRSQPVVPDRPRRGWGRNKDKKTEYRCGIFPKSPQAPQREYPSCEACVQEHGQCEERCAESGYTCAAVGYSRYGFQETIQGDLADNQQRAKQRGMRQCYDAGLNGCALGQCSETMRFDPKRVTPCQTQTVTKKKKNNNKKKTNKNKNIKKKSPPPVVPQPTQKYVTSWQHLKGKCQGRSTPKVAQQCGNRGFWHGISCRVTWSDGSTQDLHGKVDLIDPYGRAYCTRSTRPARFNCVSRCDNTNGLLMSLPKP
ncbi:MAG: hypothetical protein QTN59_12440 [Candidatus Electrothrix communis]|nr:MAG: hypothetical protein QTN59_12440 [Candidatus Electrothrix communis]